ncbi:uroporphyrinogen decarboxylase family protein [Limosilactobacillus fermentum]|uniref:uroporphyrinogen decarboxylase family protein n=1 Tax=Limosilactobacillus fermentum TaxID=1613 RepID=UPI00128E8160|nr:uroporphyrinogen decarboxylase family protein [Limosilactobacillus fermentum]MCD5423934.1 uroporphyrinogen III decarboxylase [Limosilactobacillus fermentum]MPW03308.1 uroporphyrinogen III decarboxylase [Limosilactobacillus fermentum]
MTKKQVLNQLLEQKKGRVPVSFWHHFSAASGIDLDGYQHPEILIDNVKKTRAFVEDFDPDFVKLMSDGLFNYDFNQPTAKPTSIYDGIEPISDQHEWIVKTRELVSAQKEQIGDKLGFYNVFSPTTLLKWALTKEPDGTHDKATADGLLADAIVNDRQRVKDALDVITQDVIKQATTAIEAGADGIYYSTQAIQDERIDQELFQEFVATNDQRVFDAVNELSDTNILHICGNRGSRNPLEWYQDYHAAVVNWATDVENTSLEQGKQIFKGKVVLGGLGNTANDVLYKGTKEEITQAVRNLIEGTANENVLIGANCTVPRDININHLDWAVQAADF